MLVFTQHTALVFAALFMLFYTQEAQKIVFILNQWKFESFSDRFFFFHFIFKRN